MARTLVSWTSSANSVSSASGPGKVDVMMLIDSENSTPMQHDLKGLYSLLHLLDDVKSLVVSKKWHLTRFCQAQRTNERDELDTSLECQMHHERHVLMSIYKAAQVYLHEKVCWWVDVTVSHWNA